MDVLALLDKSGGMPDGHAVLDHVLARGDVAQRILVAVFPDLHVVAGIDYHGYFFTISVMADRNWLTSLKRRYTDAKRM